jgi:hypothetical protein
MSVSLKDFKRLLLSLKEQNIKLKIKTITGWSESYLYILGFIEYLSTRNEGDFKGIILSDDAEREGMLLSDISHLMAFKLESPHETFKAKVVYTINDYSFQPVSR